MPQDISATSRAFQTGLHELRRHWGWYLALGIALIILGIIALGNSLLATLASMLVLGWLLIIGGAIQIVQAFRTRDWGGFFLHLLAGILYVVVGVLAVVNPAVSALALTLLLASFFLVVGLFRIITALVMRFPSWGWALVNGIITLLLGILIWAEWPVSGLWVIGMFVGIEMILSGWSWVMLALAARRLAY
jgi:uncharacterized membrane protein HdeD (DUF308 family)